MTCLCRVSTQFDFRWKASSFAKMLSSMPKYISENMSIRFWLDKVSYFRNTKLNYTWFSAHQTLRLSSKLLCIHNMSHLWQTMLAGVRVWANKPHGPALVFAAAPSFPHTKRLDTSETDCMVAHMGLDFCQATAMGLKCSLHVNVMQILWFHGPHVKKKCSPRPHENARFSKCKFPNFWNCRLGDKAKGTRYAALLRWIFFLGFHANTHSTNQLPMKCHGLTPDPPPGSGSRGVPWHLNDFAHQRNTSCVETSGGLPHGAHKNDLSIHRSF